MLISTTSTISGKNIKEYRGIVFGEVINGVIKVGGIEVDETTIQDIDTETDWKLAEMKYKLLFPK